jgi:ATP-dependent exoDNAse (exonuclease V) beta subunit
LTSPHRVLRASAGSGKTHQLTNAFLRIALSHSPGHVGESARRALAVTFTRKAAGEILHRILERLALAATHDSKLRELNQSLTTTLTRPQALTALHQLAAQLHRLSVGTLDGFLHRAGMAFRHELGLPTHAQLADEADPRIAELRRRALLDTLSDHALHELVDLLRRLHHDLRVRSVTQAIDDIVLSLYETYRLSPDRTAWGSLRVPEPLDTDALSDALKRFDQTALPNAFVKPHRQAREALKQGEWEDFLKYGLAPKIADGMDIFGKTPIPDEVAHTYAPLIQHAQSVLLTRLRDSTLATFDLLQRFDQRYSALRQEQGLLLHSDIPHRVTDLLDTHAQFQDDLAYRLDSRYDHLLLDEHQDTSPTQWRILRPLAEEITSREGASLFIVGDVKQAIYGWRGGCAAVFDLLGDDLPSLAPDAWETMSRSWRSSQTLLNACNRVFTDLPSNPQFNDSDRQAHQRIAEHWSRHYHEHLAERDRPGHVLLETSPPAEPDDEEDTDEPLEGKAARAARDAAHHAFVALRVGQLHRAAPSTSIALLCRTNGAVLATLQALREAGLACSGEAGNSLTDDAAVVTALAAFTFADHPGHSVAAFRVLHSPLAKILGLEQATGPHAHAVARAIRASLAERGYAATLTHWVRAVAAHAAPRSVERLTQLIALADRYQPLATIRPADFVAFARAATVEEPRPSLVRVMTIHKSKGLEFDAVFLPELDAPLGSVHGGVMRARETEVGPNLEIHRATNQLIRSFSPQLQHAHDQELHRRLTDDLCALYVAMTRARCALRLIVKPLALTRSGKLRKLHFCAAAIFRGALVHDPQLEQPQRQQTLFEEGHADWFLKGDEAWVQALPAPPTPLVPAPTPEAPPAPPKRSRPVASPSAAARTVHAAELFIPRAHAARARGIVFHRWLECVGFLDDASPWPDDGTLIDLAQRAVADASPDAPEADWTDLLAQFHAALRHHDIRAALSRPALAPGEHAELWRERPFVQAMGDRLVAGRFDRVVVVRRSDAAVRAEVMDFKTDAVAAPLAPAASRQRTPTLEEHARTYAPQLRLYRDAAARLLGLDPSAVSARLLFIEARAIVEPPG